MDKTNILWLQRNANNVCPRRMTTEAKRLLQTRYGIEASSIVNMFEVCTYRLLPLAMIQVVKEGTSQL